MAPLSLICIAMPVGVQGYFRVPKVILEEDEISDSGNENSICCDSCGTWWHLPCADLTMNVADALDSWVCQSCLADAANVNDTDIDDLDFNFVQESEETDTTNSVNHVCPVCH